MILSVRLQLWDFWKPLSLEPREGVLVSGLLFFFYLVVLLCFVMFVQLGSCSYMDPTMLHGYANLYAKLLCVYLKCFLCLRCGGVLCMIGIPCVWCYNRELFVCDWLVAVEWSVCVIASVVLSCPILLARASL